MGCGSLATVVEDDGPGVSDSANLFVPFQVIVAPENQ
jgi:hypothetical protein